MKIRNWNTLLIAGLMVGALATSPAGATEVPNGDIPQTESSSGQVTGNGASGVAAAILCGGLSRIAASTGMNPGVTSAAIAACAYMLLDGFFDFSW